MRLDVVGRRWIGVSEAPRDRPHRNPRGERLRCGEVPKIVQSPRHGGWLGHGAVPLRDRVRMEVLEVFVREDRQVGGQRNAQRGRTVDESSPLALQEIESRLVECNAAAPGESSST